MPQGLLVPSQKSSKLARPRMDAEQGAGEVELLAALRDVAGVEDAVEAVEPAVGAPGERVGQLVRVVAAEAGDDDLAACRPCRRRRCPAGRGCRASWRPRRRRGRRRCPRGCSARRRRSVNLSALPSPSVSSSTLTRSRPGPGFLPRILEALGDPDPAALVEGHRHRIDDVRLAGDQLDAESPAAPSSSASPRRARAAGPGGLSWACGITSAAPDTTGVPVAETRAEASAIRPKNRRFVACR